MQIYLRTVAALAADALAVAADVTAQAGAATVKVLNTASVTLSTWSLSR